MQWRRRATSSLSPPPTRFAHRSSARCFAAAGRWPRKYRCSFVPHFSRLGGQRESASSGATTARSWCRSQRRCRATARARCHRRGKGARVPSHRGARLARPSSVSDAAGARFSSGAALVPAARPPGGVRAEALARAVGGYGSSLMRLVFVFAHQDDEIAAALRIRRAIAAGDEVACAFLTDGKNPIVRDEESHRALASLGVTDVAFIGSEHQIGDGTLVENLDRALMLLSTRFDGADEVWTLAWEGGHHDHDAAHLVALAFAVERGRRCFEVPLYTGFPRMGPFFRVS